MLSRLAFRAVQNVKPSVTLARATVALQQSSHINSPGNEQLATYAKELGWMPSPEQLESKKIRVDSAPVRLVVIPKNWFDAFYEKTGVTGPYLLAAGLWTFLVSKEWYVVGHEFHTILGLAPAYLFYQEILFPILAEKAEPYRTKAEEYQKEVHGRPLADAQAGLAQENQFQESMHAQAILFEAKKERVALQLEAGYRERLIKVHSEVKKRLDYQVEVIATNKYFEQEHMVDWIVGNVQKSITPALEAASIKQCIADLKVLAAKA